MIAVDINNFYVFDVKSMEWREITSANVSDAAPSPRHSTGFASVSSSIFLFGGDDGNGRFSRTIKPGSRVCRSMDRLTARMTETDRQKVRKGT